MKNPKVAVAMSGGVDSSVAAALLKAQGYDTAGITMRLWSCEEAPAGAAKNPGKLCCSYNDALDARKVAGKLGIPHYIVDYRQEFSVQVVKPFCENYRKGRTPNPCVLCNEKIKFGLLLKKIKALGFDYLATGHYASIIRDPKTDSVLLKKGKDDRNDQSYWLYSVKPGNLKHILLPLGGLTKEEVRGLAKKYRLHTAEKPKSQEICFIQDNNYRAFLRQYSKHERPGRIIDKNGKILGRHAGVSNFTLGQRSGLGISAGRRIYVIKRIPEKKLVVVGDEKDVYSSEFTAKNVNWLVKPGRFPLKAQVKIRYTNKGSAGTIYKLGKILYKIVLEQPQWALTPGQSAVFYNGSTLLGGGIIQ
ncbi:MAG: tRNA 2-thiouridine(34) synthase MnmA [Elusimicrobia bacterium RIFOXYB2_FULL_48_7]|nr:MAG: tRNA 2-thiouridine(34) synthase MnmA [Elusimicrobia bacterium RIFOXYB2_FULL_48_7]